MEVRAKTKYLHMSARKVRLVVDLVRGLPVAAAETQLRFLNKEAAKVVLKLLRSAIANAEQNFSLDRSNLYVKHVTADEGPIVYRFRPRAFGKSAPIRKRTTHLSLILDEKKPLKKS